MGRGVESIYPTMVELARLHHAIPVPSRVLPPLRGVPSDRVWLLWTQSPPQATLAHAGPHFIVGGTVRCGQRVQFFKNNILGAGQPAPWSSADLAGVYVD